MAATAAAAAAAAASKWRNGVFALPPSLLPPLPPSRPTLWLARSWMAIYLCLRTLCARAGERERGGGSGAPAPEDNSNFHLSNCKT